MWDFYGRKKNNQSVIGCGWEKLLEFKLNSKSEGQSSGDLRLLCWLSVQKEANIIYNLVLVHPHCSNNNGHQDDI